MCVFSGRHDICTRRHAGCRHQLHFAKRTWLKILHSAGRQEFRQRCMIIICCVALHVLIVGVLFGFSVFCLYYTCYKVPDSNLVKTVLLCNTHKAIPAALNWSRSQAGPPTTWLHIIGNTQFCPVKHSHALDTPYPPLGLIWTVMLVWRKGNINRTVSVLSIV